MICRGHESRQTRMTFWADLFTVRGKYGRLFRLQETRMGNLHSLSRPIEFAGWRL